MPKLKKSPNLENNTFEEYGNTQLLNALNSLESSLGWEVFKNFVHYQASVHGTMSNMLIQQSNKQVEACAAGAKAEVLRDMVDQFLNQLRSKISRTEGVVENPMPEESSVS